MSNFDATMPTGCDPCRFCGGYCMEAETDDHEPLGTLRIVALCDKADHLYRVRTQHRKPEDAVKEWNEVFGVNSKVPIEDVGE